MPRYTLAPIVRPSDLRARTIPSHVAEAVRKGTARLIGFESQGDALRMLEQRADTAWRPATTRIRAGARMAIEAARAACEPARTWTSLADIADVAVAAVAEGANDYPRPARTNAYRIRSGG